MFELHGGKIFQTLMGLATYWRVYPVINFKTPELIDVRASWPVQPIIKKEREKSKDLLQALNSLSTRFLDTHISKRMGTDCPDQ